MKYFSRDPDDWKKQEQEFLKREKENTKKYRRQGFYFLIFNLVVVLIFFFGLRLYYAQLPSEESDINQLLLQVESPYNSGSPLDLQVRLYNNYNKEREVILDGFTLSINKGDKTVYSFVQKDTVSASLEPFTSRLLFDLKREVELTSLEAGEYIVHVKVNVNGQQITAQKTFLSVEKYQVDVDGLMDFYFPGEIMKLSVYLINNTAHLRDLEVKSLKVTLKKNNEIIWQEDSFDQKMWSEVGVGKSVLVEDDLKFQFQQEGRYILSIQAEVNGSLTSLSLPVACVREYDYGSNIEKVDFYTDAPKQNPLGAKMSFSVYLQNPTAKDIFLLLDKLEVLLPPSALDFQKTSVRIWLDPYARYEIFKFLPKNSSAITQPGIYKLIVRIHSSGKTREFESHIQILE